MPFWEERMQEGNKRRGTEEKKREKLKKKGISCCTLSSREKERKRKRKEAKGETWKREKGETCLLAAVRRVGAAGCWLLFETNWKSLRFLGFLFYCLKAFFFFKNCYSVPLEPLAWPLRVRDAHPFEGHLILASARWGEGVARLRPALFGYPPYLPKRISSLNEWASDDFP